MTRRKDEIPKDLVIDSMATSEFNIPLEDLEQSITFFKISMLLGIPEYMSHHTKMIQNQARKCLYIIYGIHIEHR